MEPRAPSLHSLRHEIASIDADLVRLLAARREVSERLRALKAREGTPRLDPTREEAVRAAWRSAASAEAVPESLALAVLELVLADSRAIVSAP